MGTWRLEIPLKLFTAILWSCSWPSLTLTSWTVCGKSSHKPANRGIPRPSTWSWSENTKKSTHSSQSWRIDSATTSMRSGPMARTRRLRLQSKTPYLRNCALSFSSFGSGSFSQEFPSSGANLTPTPSCFNRLQKIWRRTSSGWGRKYLDKELCPKGCTQCRRDKLT